MAHLVNLIFYFLMTNIFIPIKVVHAKIMPQAKIGNVAFKNNNIIIEGII